MMRPGWQTTEFWTTLVGQVLSLLALTGLIHVREVGPDELGPAALGGDLPRHGLAPLGVAAADDEAGRAAFGEGAGDGLAQSLRASGDDGDGVLELG